MSSLVRRIQTRAMERLGVEPDKSRPIYKAGEVVGHALPLLIPAGMLPPSRPAAKRDGPARGRRRGKRNKRYIEARKAARA